MNSIWRSFQVRGVTLKPWDRSPELVTFQWFTMHGLLDLRECVSIISINNETPGNGKFQAFMTTIAEKSADENAVKIQVVQIWSEKLRDGLKKHGYVIANNSEHGTFAIRPARLMTTTK